MHQLSVGQFVVLLFLPSLVIRILPEAISLAVLELVFYVLMNIIQRVVRKTTDDRVQDYFDQGPWWSIAFHRAWMVYHFAAICFQLLLSWVRQDLKNGKTAALPIPALHAVNFFLLLLILNIPR